MGRSEAPPALAVLLSRYWAFFLKFPWFGDSEEEIQKKFGCSNGQLMLLHLIGILLALVVMGLWIFEPIRQVPLPSWAQGLLFILATLLLRPAFMLALQWVMPMNAGGDDDEF